MVKKVYLNYLNAYPYQPLTGEREDWGDGAHFIGEIVKPPL